MKSGVIVQARMGSSRLPGKVLNTLCNKPVLWHVIERLKQSTLINDIIIATTTLEEDNSIVNFCNSNDVNFFRGSSENVLSRYYNAALEYNLDTIIRVTSDCPLIDPKILDEVIDFYNNNTYALVTNAGIFKEKRTYPRGLDIEVFNKKSLEEAFKFAVQSYEKEHVTPYIYENINNIYFYMNNKNLSELRWTLDTNEDYELISKIYNLLYKGIHNFYFKDILNIIEKYPELKKINSMVEQKKLK